MKKLRDFYLYEDKVIHATQDFLGYNPMISIPIRFPGFQKPGEAHKEHNFVVGDRVFRAVVSTGLFYGPIRGYKQIEIYLEEKRIICQRRGSYGHGSNFSEGTNRFIYRDTAYMAVEGNSLRDFTTDSIFENLEADAYYLLLFNNVTIPKAFPLVEPELKDQQRTYLQVEMEPYRQKFWGGRLELGEQILNVVTSVVPGFCMQSDDGTTILFHRMKGCNSLERKEFPLESMIIVSSIAGDTRQYLHIAVQTDELVL